MTDIVFLLCKKNLLIIINEHSKINIRSNLKVFKLFSLKIERRDEKFRDSGTTELKGPKNLFAIVKGLEIPIVIKKKNTRNAEETKETKETKVRDNMHSRLWMSTVLKNQH